MALIKELQGLDPIYVFAGKNGMMSDKVMGRAMRRLFEIGALDIEPVRPHDFRRTIRTHLEKLNVAPHIAEKYLKVLLMLCTTKTLTLMKGAKHWSGGKFSYVASEPTRKCNPHKAS